MLLQNVDFEGREGKNEGKTDTFYSAFLVQYNKITQLHLPFTREQ